MTGRLEGNRRLAQPHDPTYSVRRALWLAYGVLGAGIILLVVALVLLGQHGLSLPPNQGPTVLRPSSSPTVQPSATPTPSATPVTQVEGQAAPTGSGSTGNSSTSSGRLTSTGYPPGEPPGDVEDDSPNSSRSSAPQQSAPSATVLPLPSLPVVLPTPTIP